MEKLEQIFLNFDCDGMVVHKYLVAGKRKYEYTMVTEKEFENTPSSSRTISVSVYPLDDRRGVEIYIEHMSHPSASAVSTCGNEQGEEK